MRVEEDFIDYVEKSIHQVFKRHDGVEYRFSHSIVSNNNSELSLQYEISTGENAGGFQVVVTLGESNSTTTPIKLKILTDPETDLNHATIDLIKADLLIVESDLNTEL